MGKILTGHYDRLLDTPSGYEESIDLESYRLEDNSTSVEIVVPPGQEHRRAATWTDLKQDVVAGRFRGIVQVVSYGYHSLGQISVRQHKLFTGDIDEFVPAYLSNRLSEELVVLEHLSSSIELASGKLWMLTLVSKQDLWWDDRDNVEAEYRQGQYAKALQKIIEQKDPQQFRHELVFASLVISNFETGLRERLKPNTAGYDHALQVKSLRGLIETFDALREWEQR